MSSDPDPDPNDKAIADLAARAIRSVVKDALSPPRLPPTSPQSWPTPRAPGGGARLKTSLTTAGRIAKLEEDLEVAQGQISACEVQSAQAITRLDSLLAQMVRLFQQIDAGGGIIDFELFNDDHGVGHRFPAPAADDDDPAPA